MATANLPATAPAPGPAVAIDEEAVLRHLKLNPREVATQALLLACRRYGLDPLLKHAVLIQGQLYVTRDGLLYVAHRSGQLDGITVDDQGENPTHWTAKVSVYRKDMTRPFSYVGRYPKSGHMKAYGPEMAVKVGEVMALRRAFNIGICAREELWDQEDAPAEPSRPYPGDPPAKSYAKPEGGDPRGDEDFRQWARGFVESVNEKWAAKWGPEAGDVLSPQQLAGHLYKTVAGGRERDGVTFAHRLRAVANALAADPEGLYDEANSYALQVMTAAREALESAREPGQDG